MAKIGHHAKAIAFDKALILIHSNENRYRQAGRQIEQNYFLCLTKKNDLSSGVECTKMILYPAL